MEVKTPGNVELWQLLGEQHTHNPQPMAGAGAVRIQLLFLPPTTTTSRHILGNDFSSDPPFHQSIPAVQSLPELAAPRCRRSATAFQGTVLVEQLRKSLCWDTLGQVAAL